MKITEEKEKEYHKIYWWSKVNESSKVLSERLDKLADYIDSIENIQHYRESGLVIHPDNKDNMIELFDDIIEQIKNFDDALKDAMKNVEINYISQNHATLVDISKKIKRVTDAYSRYTKLWNHLVIRKHSEFINTVNRLYKNIDSYNKKKKRLQKRTIPEKETLDKMALDALEKEGRL